MLRNLVSSSWKKECEEQKKSLLFLLDMFKEGKKKYVIFENLSESISWIIVEQIA